MLELPQIASKQKRPPYRKPEAVRELERLANIEAQRLHPSIDSKYLAPRTFRDDTANSLTAAIVKYISLQGGMASRINTTGLWDQKRNKYRVSTQKRGLADIWATYKGLSLQIEVKTSRDRQSKFQEQIQQQQQQAGGLYYIARNFTEFFEWFNRL